MDSPTILPILKKIPIFKDLNEAEHQEIIRNIVLNYYPLGHVFFKEGDKELNDGMYIIKHGMVKISRITPTGEDKGIAALTDNDFFGEMALVLSEPRNATATVISDCEAFSLRKQDFLILMQSNLTLASKISKEFMNREKQNNKPGLI